ncbi:MAG: hypothetical protein A2599_00935 [Candidatus Staskawiczbacteria bacterium RIFOXYD1_FULL_39_28]|uniref:Uncharacterized protein n=1 Tax=Candidatus Staskawiczbacteria bacterium RIFOXYC1_FULL_38_18 TaxID=1802229 RepID=A0A1G2JAD4_9BACT|nr:MAG: hypothetical protein A2401_00655 [Candidatus Staskawiczbacteria bacterium RIFOXYC1_FULL_38_18]OGZ91400.1 MAG: hypothetical protein A2599_00935 [Candidatus Staskawiczbacteria bacterium RIFOXYD1_FULL_39_28]
MKKVIILPVISIMFMIFLAPLSYASAMVTANKTVAKIAPHTIASQTKITDSYGNTVTITKTATAFATPYYRGVLVTRTVR